MRKTKWPLVSYPNTSISTNTTYPNRKPQQTAKSCDPKLINHSKIGQFLAIMWRFLQKNMILLAPNQIKTCNFEAIRGQIGLQPLILVRSHSNIT